MEGLRAQPLRFEPDAELDGQIVGAHQHIVHQPDGIGETPFGIAFGQRQARGHALLGKPIGLVEPL